MLNPTILIILIFQSSCLHCTKSISGVTIHFFMLLSSLLLDVSGRDAAALPITTDFWPPAMSSAVPRIVGLLDNSSVTSSQVAGELNTLIIEPFHFRTTQDVYTVNSFDHS